MLIYFLPLLDEQKKLMNEKYFISFLREVPGGD
jgi:hypothetical protein